jgi:hypothetical protein
MSVNPSGAARASVVGKTTMVVPVPTKETLESFR